MSHPLAPSADDLIDEYLQQQALDKEIAELLQEETNRKPCLPSRKEGAE